MHKSAALALARKGEAQRFGRNRVALLPVFGQVVDDGVVAVALRPEVAVDDLRLEPAGSDHFLFQILQDGAILRLDQTPVILLRGGLELPLILEQRGVVDVLEDLPQIEVVRLEHAHSPERRLRNVRRSGNFNARTRRRLGVENTSRGSAGKLLHHFALLNTLLARAIR